MTIWNGLRLACRLARREARGGLRDFRLLVACLALGVAAIAAAGSLRAAFDSALDSQARSLIGGDLALAQPHAPASTAELSALAALGRVTRGIEMRGMATVDGNRDRALVEVKAVDDAYPLVGAIALAPAQPLAQALERRDGRWGAVADPTLLARLGLAAGSPVRLGDAAFEIRGAIAHEPDRIATALGFGPRLMVALPALAETGLIRPGSLIRHTVRLDLTPGTTAAQARAILAARFPDAAWQIRDTAEPAPGLGRFLDSVTAFLTLIGLTALLVGGIGVANAVRAYLDGRADTIATLKCLGASSRLIFTTYFLLVALLSGLGILAGVSAGAALAAGAITLAGPSLPLPAQAGFHAAPLALAAGFGAMSALLFTLAPLGRARRHPAARLFRHRAAATTGNGGPWPDRATLVALTGVAAGLAALTIATSGNRPLAAGFVAVTVAVLALFRALAWAMARGAAGLAAAVPHRIGASGRMALANLHRPGSPLTGMVVSMGLGLSVLATIAVTEGNLAEQFGTRLPRLAPTYFLIDIQPDQEDAARASVAAADPAARIDLAPMVRGRISTIKGVAVESAAIAPDVAWAARGDRGLSSATIPPAGTRLVAGAWWPADYAGPPLVSVDRAVARGFGLGVGDRIGLNVLGRDIEAEVASLRDIDWASLSMNFAFLLSPGALDGAPRTLIATLHVSEGRDLAVEKAVTDRLPNVSAIRVKEALATARSVIDQADLAVRLAAAVTIAAGAIVLAGAVMAGHRRRAWDAVMLKVLGASRAQIGRIQVIEFALIGGATGMMAAVIGQAAAWALLTLVMKADWRILPGVTLATLAGCTAAAVLAGLIGTWRALKVPAASVLRED